MENLKKEIFDVVDFTLYTKDDCVDVTKYIHLVKDNIWDTAINTALKENKRVYIPKMEKEIQLASSIIMDDDYVLIADYDQVITNAKDNNCCMIMSKNAKCGSYNKVDRTNCNKNIYIEGGIWDPTLFNGATHLAPVRKADFFGVFAVMFLSNIENLTVRCCKFCNSSSYATQVSNIKGFLIENIKYINYQKDGVHLNGPSSYGVIRNLEGENMADDLVAFNAWDWDRSATTFGTLDHVFVENIKSNNNEIRLLPGRKTFRDSESVDCDITNSIFKDITGVYTFKMYCQKNWREAFDFSYNDHSETVGHMANIYFENIVFDKVRADGFSDIPVNGLFDCCSDCENLYYNNIEIKMDKEEFDKLGLKLLSVGPLTYTWKNHYPDEPEKWRDLFEPDAICHVKNVSFKNITFNGKKIESLDEVMGEIHLSVNEDYPNTTPKGGTGYGTIDKESCVIE